VRAALLALLVGCVEPDPPHAFCDLTVVMPDLSYGTVHVRWDGDRSEVREVAEEWVAACQAIVPGRVCLVRCVGVAWTEDP
jgi:hypothetical protein